MLLSDKCFAPAIRQALREDIGRGDLTTSALFDSPIKARADVVSLETGILAGLEAARLTFHEVDSYLIFISKKSDGDPFQAGDVLASVSGDGRKILTAERVALNFLQHLSGIATTTRQFVEAASGCRIVDTRKTTPGLRALEKYAIRVGGGFNHRFGLDDGILIKDNHLELAGGPDALPGLIRQARTRAPHLMKIEVEADDIRQVELAAKAGTDVILLDNMSVEETLAAVKLAKSINPNILIEASGGVTLEKAAALSKAGVDVISIGRLTHSVKAIDISLELHLER